MTTPRERYLLKRCLLLEARIGALEGRAAESMPATPPARRVQRPLAPADIATIHALRLRRLSSVQIARRLRCSETTVRVHLRALEAAP